MNRTRGREAMYRTSAPELPPITAALDPKIAPLVHALRGAGYPTIASCAGCENCMFKFPTITILTNARTSIAEARRRRLTRWLAAAGIEANIATIYSTLPDPMFPIIRVEILSDLAEARL